MPASPPVTAAEPRRWRFGRVLFDEASSELRVDGAVVEVERKPLDVLSVLLDQAGKVVTKSALVQRAWPSRVIGDAALAKAIARLREALGDADHQIVRTHHRYGYRLVAEVSVDSTANGPAAMRAVPTPLPTVAAPLPTPVRVDAEHRVLTMLFCDLVGSTELAETLDPETFRELLLDYQHSTAEIVQRYEGHVAQQFGDGMLFYFGYPAAHDDDAERAVRCACDLLRFVGRTGAFTQAAMRIGVHTGPIVIGQSRGGSEVQATGANLHIAARLQALAEPNSILISDATFRLVPGLFVTRDFGPQALRGLAEPLRVHQVLQPSGVRSRLDAQPRLTPFVGREAELALATECWRQAVEGEGRAILFRGEPGMGKSRLLLELRARLAGSAHTWLEARADALNRQSSYHVVSELLRRGFALKDGDSDAQRLLDLERRLDDLGLDRNSTIPLLAPLLNLAESRRYPAPNLTPENRRARMLECLLEWMTQLADVQPLAVVAEDLHWCDASSVEFVKASLARLARLPVLLVLTARPEFSPQWHDGSAVHEVELPALPRQDVERMLLDLSCDRQLTARLCTRIVDRAAGVPLFVEELARSVHESGSYEDIAAVPESLQSVLHSRLDRLGSARDLIQAAAVIGMECGHDLLQHVSGLDSATLSTGLQSLTEAGMLHVRQIDAERRYIFKHALIRDSAYGSLVKSMRQRLHARTAEAIERLSPNRLDAQAAVLAQHWEAAGGHLSAARWTARWALLTSGTDAALSLQLWKRVPVLVRSVPHSPEQADLAATAYAQILALLWRCAATDAEITSVFEEGCETVARDGGPAASARLISSYAVIRGIGGSAADYVPLSREAARLAAQSDDAALQELTRCLAACAHWWTGDFAEAVRATRAIFDSIDLDASPLLWGGMDIRLGVMFNIALALGYAGEVAEACLHLARTCEVTARANDPITRCHALSAMAWFAEFTLDGARAIDCARQALQLAEIAGASFERVVALIGEGVANNVAGQSGTAERALEEALGLVRSTRAGLSLEALILSHLADTRLALGDRERALQAANEAIERSRRNGSRGLDARALLTRARLLRHSGPTDMKDLVLAALDGAEVAVRLSAAESYRPMIHEERGLLANACGDRALALHELRQAHALYGAIGAPRLAMRVAEALMNAD